MASPLELNKSPQQKMRRFVDVFPLIVRESGHPDFLFDEAPGKSYYNSYNKEPFVPRDWGYGRSWLPINPRHRRFFLAGCPKIGR
jgi:hypothetical protein